MFGVRPGAPSPDGPALTFAVTDVVSASDVVAFVEGKKEEFASALSTPLPAVGLPSSPLAVVPAGTPALAAFAAIRAAGASAAALVDDGGKLIGVLSPSDLRGLDARSAAALSLSAAELAAASAAGASPWDAGAAPFGERVEGAAAGDWAKVLSRAPPVAVATDATLGDVVAAVTRARVHRAYVVGEGGRPVGVVELNDVLRVLTVE